MVSVFCSFVGSALSFVLRVRLVVSVFCSAGVCCFFKFKRPRDVLGYNYGLLSRSYHERKWEKVLKINQTHTMSTARRC